MQHVYFRLCPCRVGKSVNQTGVSGRFRGGLGGSLEPPLRLKYLIFMENFQKNQETLINDLIKLANRTPLYKFEPPYKDILDLPLGIVGGLFEQI